MAQVKGQWLVDWVKMIKKYLEEHPESKEELDKLLKEEDWAIINSMVLPLEYYDYASFQRIGQAVFKVIAKSNLELSLAFGKLMIMELIKFYKRILVANDPVVSLQRFIEHHGKYFEDVKSQCQMISQTAKVATIKLGLTPSDKNLPEAAQAFAWQLGGSFEQLIAVAGGHDVKLEIIRDLDGNFIYNLSWE